MGVGGYFYVFYVSVAMFNISRLIQHCPTVLQSERDRERERERERERQIERETWCIYMFSLWLCDNLDWQGPLMHVCVWRLAV